jgi:membrane-associated phospholipid phosphatase
VSVWPWAVLWRGRRTTMAWLTLVALLAAALLVAIDLVFVYSTRGQLVDDASLRGTTIGRSHIINPVSVILEVISVSALGLATIAVGVVGFLRKRPVLALLAMMVVAGSVLSTELLKYQVFNRPLLDTVTDRLPYNTLPSGHTTIALSVGVGMTLVAPARWRVLVGSLGVIYGAATGVATMSAGWHRPSDAVAACVVVAIWVALVGVVAAALGPPGERPPPANDSPYTVVVVFFTLLAVLLLVVGTVALIVTAYTVPQPSTRPRLFLAYAGGASAVAGAAFAVMAGLLVVTRRTGTDELDDRRAARHRMLG